MFPAESDRIIRFNDRLKFCDRNSAEVASRIEDIAYRLGQMRPASFLGYFGDTFWGHGSDVSKRRSSECEEQGCVIGRVDTRLIIRPIKSQGREPLRCFDSGLESVTGDMFEN